MRNGNFLSNGPAKDLAIACSNCTVTFRGRQRLKVSNAPDTPSVTTTPTHQHVLRQPSFAASDRRSDSQRETLLAEQRIPTVTTAVRDDFVLGRNVGDQDLVRIAGPVCDQFACGSNQEIFKDVCLKNSGNRTLPAAGSNSNSLYSVQLNPSQQIPHDSVVLSRACWAWVCGCEISFPNKVPSTQFFCSPPHPLSKTRQRDFSQSK